MRILGIIAEYNPLHRGHLYQLEEAKRLSGAEGVIVVMSGSFTQRGEPALTDKYRRAAMALAAGADAVLELPPAAATGSAGNFAAGAVGILKACGCVTDLSFGSECGDPALLRQGAEALSALEDSALVKAALKAGASYPRAVAEALRQTAPELSALTEGPNDTLALEYLRALKRQDFAPAVHPVKRQGAGHGEETLREGRFAGAGAIRQALRTGTPREQLKAWLPDFSLERLDYALGDKALFALLVYRLLELEREGRELTAFDDVPGDLAARLREAYPRCGSFRELTEQAATKAFTQARVRRALIHILLDLPEGAGKQPPTALKLLGLRKDSPVPGLLKKTAKLPLVTKTVDAPPELVRDTAYSAAVYNLLVRAECGLTLPSDHLKSPEIL